MVVVKDDISDVLTEEKRFKRDVDPQNQIPTITDFYVSSSVNARFATVVIQSRVVNTNPVSLHATFRVQLPETAFIANFSMVVNDTVYVAKVFPKEEAQKKFDEAKAKNQSAGQVRNVKTDTLRGMDDFMIDTNVKAGVEAVFYLTYQELLVRRVGLYKQRIVVQPGQIVKNLTVKAVFNENQGFDKFFYTFPNSTTVFTTSSDVVTLTATPNTRTLVYKPTELQQSASSTSKGLDGEFVISYDVPHQRDGGMVIVEDEYFVHYLTPTGIETMDKNILFVIDVSGSMGGLKIAQARNTMLNILDRLNPNDYFNILTFESDIKSWVEVPVDVNSNTIARAKEFVKANVQSGGSTNINGALLHAIKSLKRLSEQSRRAQVIVFLTDGHPSAGVTNTKTIRKNVYKENYGLASIYCLGFGFDLDFSFLKSLAYENGGFARRIYDEDDAANQIEHFYQEVKDPVLQNVVVSYDSDAVDLQSTTKKSFYQYFEGSEIVIAGKTKTADVLQSEKLSVVGLSRNGDIDLPVGQNQVIVWSDNEGFTEKLWAYKKIKELLEEYNVHENDTAKSLALNMSLEYNFVTPLTSFVFVQEDQYKSESNKMHPNVKVYANPGYNFCPGFRVNYLSSSLLVFIAWCLITER
ncbi:hypothetical protein LOTGIDRAFT_107242 [Lottia gigantea]|uniref:VWFA domain-containing protein n=1 Tax=Lottia gigantea TaxID=225164 RepID=V4BE80_LOTGI|nr:hypothetical protein LOTGIDRAFT_107242 [Lottia gigantea]ESO87139.1 hypothetical protein LOTGIDRAFT_107242 [Lottia gigantea]